MAKQQLDLADKSVEQLQDELQSMENELQQMRFDHAVKGLSNPMEIRDLRRNVARVNTELRSRELAEISPEDWDQRSKIRDRRRRQK